MSDYVFLELVDGCVQNPVHRFEYGKRSNSVAKLNLDQNLEHVGQGKFKIEKLAVGQLFEFSFYGYAGKLPPMTRRMEVAHREAVTRGEEYAEGQVVWSAGIRIVVVEVTENKARCLRLEH